MSDLVWTHKGSPFQGFQVANISKSLGPGDIGFLNGDTPIVAFPLGKRDKQPFYHTSKVILDWVLYGDFPWEFLRFTFTHGISKDAKSTSGEKLLLHSRQTGPKD